MIKLKFPLKSNYPNYSPDVVTLLPTPDRVQADRHVTGKEVTIGFVDSGFSMHPDIAERIVMHVDASTNRIVEQKTIAETTPMSWHGQMTSVIAAGSGKVSDGRFRGIASDANLVLIKVSTPDFRIKEHDILRGLQWVYDTRHRHDIRIVNVSVGGDLPNNKSTHPLHRVVKKLVDAGIVVVIAAGNGGHNSIVPPASSPEALVVGGYDDQNSLDKRDWTLYHHNFGSAHDGTNKPDILAPANWIASPLLPESETEREIFYLNQMLKVSTKGEVAAILQEGYDALNLSEFEIETVDQKLYNKLQDRVYHHKIIDAHHQYVDGTSVAAPITTAIIAQMLEINQNLTPEEVRNILVSTAEPVENISQHKQGAGRISAKAAVNAVREAHLIG